MADSVEGTHLPAISQDSDRLEQLCSTLLGILRPSSELREPGGSCPVAALRDELADIVQSGIRELAGRLEEELPQWTAAFDQVHRLAQCRYLPLPANLAAFQDELEQTKQQAERVTQALHALGDDRFLPLPECPAQPPALLSEPATETLAEETVCIEAVHAPTEAGFAAEAPSEDTLEESPDVEPIYQQAEASRLAKDYDRALALYSEAIGLNRNHRRARLRRGQLRLLRGRCASAVEDFTAALGIAAQDAEVYQCRGDAQAIQGRLAEAEADYTRCLALDPSRSRARFNRAVAYRLQGQLSRALTEFTRVVQEHPDHGSAYFNRGLVYSALGSSEQAIADFTRAIELHPKHPEAQARRKEERRLQRQRATIPPAPAPVPSRKTAAALGSTFLPFDCPSCQARGAVRWDRLGHLHACRRCRRCFRLNPSGRVVEVIQKRDGQWVDKLGHERTSGRDRAVRILTRRVLPAAALVALAFLVFRLTSRPPAPPSVELPHELTSRAEMFTHAWLKKDWPLMKRFAMPGEDRPLYNWSVRHPPPSRKPPSSQAEADTRIEVAVLSSQVQPTTVRVRIRGLAGKSDSSVVEVLQSWEERGGAWFFVPPTKPGGQSAAAGSGRGSHR